jgi:signal peptidase I
MLARLERELFVVETFSMNRWNGAFCLVAVIASVATTPLVAAMLTDRPDSPAIVRLFKSAGILVKSFLQPTKKMMPTMAEGDEILADLRQAGLQPQRGELVLSKDDDGDVHFDRVVGLPGDHVALRAGRVILNGQEVAQKPAGVLDDCGAMARNHGCNLFVETLPGSRSYMIARNIEGGGFFDESPEIVVPVGRLYLFGDNRDNSVDSRIASRDMPS